MRWLQLTLIVALAALSFAGSFECHGSTHTDDSTTKGG